jgi:hypothetical protein
MERRLDKMRLCALLIDATPFQGRHMVAALGIGEDGGKTILGLRQGATENATVVGELLGDLLVLLCHKQTLWRRIVLWDHASPRQAHRRSASRHISTAWQTPRAMLTDTRR